MHYKDSWSYGFIESQAFKRDDVIHGVGEKLAKAELDDYLHETCIDCLHDDSLKWWHNSGSQKNLCPLMLEKDFLSIC